MNKMSPEQPLPENQDSAVILPFESKPDENALNPELLTDMEIIDAFLAESTHMIGARDKKDVAGIVSRLLTEQQDDESVSSLRSMWQEETARRIAMAGELVAEDDIYEDPIVLEIVQRLRATVPRAKDYVEERLALRQLIDARTIVLANPDMITEDREGRWEALVDKLHHLDT